MKKADSSFLDRVILHNKNADERLFDLILRSVTFIVLIIIVWLYADLVHVKADTQYNDVVSFVYHGNSLGFSEPYLNDIDYFEACNTFSDIPSGASFLGIGHFSPFITQSMDLDNNFVVLGGTPTDQYPYYAVFLIPKDVVINGNFVLCGQYHAYIKSSFDFTCFEIPRSSVSDTSTYIEYHWNTASRLGYLTFGKALQNSNNDWGVYFTNIPMLFGSNSDNVSDIEDWLENGNNENIFNGNYLTYHDLSFMPSDVEVESSKNHLALSDVQVGLSSFYKEMTDLSESSVVIGVGVDDNWILSHMNDYTVGIEYHFYIKDSNMNQADPVSMYNQTIPLSYFNDSPVTNGCANIMSSSMIAPFPSNRDFYSYYRSLSSSYGQKVVTREHRDGFFPAVLKNIYKFTIGGYTIENPVTTNNTIFEFYLDVNVRLMSEGESSGYYTKRFDFKRGTVSILSADAFQNPNPWDGPTSPESEYDPNVPSNPVGNTSGGGSSAVAYGGNVTIYNNNNNSLVGSGSDTDTDTGIDNFMNVFNTFKSSFNEMSSVGTPQDNGFMGFLNASFGFIPGLNYIVICVGVVFSLSVVSCFW